MKTARTFFALIVAALIGSAIGDSIHPTSAQAASANVLMWCTNAAANVQGGTVQSVTVSCTNAPADSSGVTVNMTITQPTQRYPLNTTATITLP